MVIPTEPARCAARMPSSASRPTNTTSCPRSAIHASFVPNPPGRPGSTPTRDVRLVELERGADVHDERARALLQLELARGEDARRPPLASGPAIDVDDRLEVRRLGGSARVARSTKRSSSSSPSSSLCRRSNPIVEETFMSIPGPRTGAAQMPGPHLHAVGQAEQLVQRAEDAACPRPCPRRGRAARCLPRTGCHRSARPRAPGRAPCRSERTRRARAGARECAARARARTPAPAPSRRRRARGRSPAAHRGARGSWRRSRWRAAVAGDVVGMVVRLEDVLDRHAHVARQ